MHTITGLVIIGAAIIVGVITILNSKANNKKELDKFNNTIKQERTEEDNER